ncbi:hypothetical protein U9M48_035110 [Paspalum notatum var. saurae]|uniref:Uncharacterized protein n=1 Tax=Paspalum notatum var. saurae TaxID=547442 RepID=A0AAQ3UEJ8_PASNO
MVIQTTNNIGHLAIGVKKIFRVKTVGTGRLEIRRISFLVQYDEIKSRLSLLWHLQNQRLITDT